MLVTLACLRTGLAREALGATCQAGSSTTGRAIGQIRPLPARPSTNAHHVRLTSPSNTAMSVWPLADPLRDWEVLT